MESLSKEPNWVVEIMEKATDLNIDHEWNKQSIYRVPTFLTDHNREAYRPQVVSFGPYHHGEDRLKFMDQHKLRALRQILKRSGKPIEVFLYALREVDQQLKDCYDQLEEQWINDDNRFLLLMLRDGCFMLEILRTIVTEMSNDGGSLSDDFHHGYASNDPIFSLRGNIHWLPFIRRDMLLLENQLPLLVLEKLVAIETGNAQSHRWINRYVLNLWSRESCAPDRPFTHMLDGVRDSFVRKPYNHSSVEQESDTSAVKIDRSAMDTHMLQAFNYARIPNNPSLVDQDSDTSAVKIDRDHRTSETRAVNIVRSARELYESGVTFKKSETDRFTDVNFRDGILSLPVIIVDDGTKSMLLNFMAYERSHVAAGIDVSLYVILMDNLIDGARDVRILRSEGIVENALGSDEEVAQLFNALSQNVTFIPTRELREVERKVNEYCRRSWNVWRANFMQKYMRSPWTALSLLAATVLLVLPLIQTIYAALSYGH